jgi:hypothetical protein
MCRLDHGCGRLGPVHDLRAHPQQVPPQSLGHLVEVVLSLAPRFRFDPFHLLA